MCHTCGETGHWRKDCKSDTKKTIRAKGYVKAVEDENGTLERDGKRMRLQSPPEMAWEAERRRMFGGGPTNPYVKELPPMSAFLM